MWLLSTAIVACKSEQLADEIPVIKVNPTELNKRDILDLTDTILVNHLIVPDSLVLGRIRQLKQYGEDLFLVNKGNRTTILIFNGLIFKNQFDRFGKGPGEYQSINSFLVDVRRREIVINDPRQSAILIYDLDNHDLKEKRMVNAVFTNMEAIDHGQFLLAADVEGQGNLNFLQVVDRNMDSSSIHLATDYPLVRQSYLPNHFTQSGSEIHFSEPFTEMVYKISSKKITPHVHIDFGDHKFPEEYWRSEDFAFIEEKLFGTPHAFTSNLYSETKNNIRFFYMWGMMEPRLVVYDLESKVVQNIQVSKETLEDGMLPYPATFASGFYSQIFYSSELELDENSFWRQRIAATENETLVWVRYKLK